MDSQIAKVTYAKAMPYGKFLQLAHKRAEPLDLFSQQIVGGNFNTATFVIHPTFAQDWFQNPDESIFDDIPPQDRLYFREENYSLYLKYLEKLKGHLIRTNSLVFVFSTPKLEESIGSWLGDNFCAPLVKIFTPSKYVHPLFASLEEAIEGDSKDYQWIERKKLGSWERLTRALMEVEIKQVNLTGEFAWPDLKGDFYRGCVRIAFFYLRSSSLKVKIIKRLTFPNILMDNKKE